MQCPATVGQRKGKRMSVVRNHGGRLDAAAPVRRGTPRSAPAAARPTADGTPSRAGWPIPPPCAPAHGHGAAKGRRLSDQEFLSVLAAPAPGWDLDEGGRFLLLPLAERDRAWMLESCREDAEGDWHALRGGEAVVFARERDFAFARLLAL